MKYFFPFLLLAVLVISLGNSSQHPTNVNGGYTRAPLDGACTQCHRNPNNNLSGSFELNGLPEITIAGQSYELQVTISNPDDDAVRAGFQLVGTESDLTNAGEWQSANQDVLIKRGGQRNYVGHAPAKEFDSERLATWLISWIPGENDNGVNTIYGGAMIANGANGNSGDRAIFRQWNTTTLLPEDTLISEILINRPISNCRDTMDGQIAVSLIGGIQPFNYVWSTSDTTEVLDSIAQGIYAVTITDSIGQVAISEIEILRMDPLEIAALTVTDLSNPTMPDGMIEISINGGNTPYNITWFNVDSTESIGVGSSINGLDQGAYWAVVEDASGCVITSDTLTITMSTAVVNNLKESLQIYPNPSADYIILKNETLIDQVIIYDKAGKMIMNRTVNSDYIKLNHNLSPGIYFINVVDRSHLRNNITRPFIVH